MVCFKLSVWEKRLAISHWPLVFLESHVPLWRGLGEDETSSKFYVLSDKFW
jgi:hypothetical protein